MGSTSSPFLWAILLQFTATFYYIFANIRYNILNINGKALDCDGINELYTKIKQLTNKR
jgi:hypothetical protein